MKKRINNTRFTIRFVHCMDNLGITTVGQANTFLNKCSPHCKIQGVRAIFLKRELDAYLA